MQVNKLTGTINILNIKTYIYDYNIYSQLELPINTNINVKYNNLSGGIIYNQTGKYDIQVIHSFTLRD